MRLSCSRYGRPLALAAVGLFSLLLVSPANAEPQPGDLDLRLPSSLASVEGQPQPVYPNGPPQTGSESSGGLAAQPKPIYPDGRPGADTGNASPKAEQKKPATDPVSSDEDQETAKSEDETAEPPKPVIVANIDKGTQEMTVFIDGVETHTWPVSTGIGGYSTPTGEYTTTSMNKIWYSRQWDNAPMPHAVFFTKKGHAIHATNEVKKLGSPASRGCVRLSPKNAETFYTHVKKSGLKNTQVVLTGVTPGGEYKVTEPPRHEQVYPGYRGYYDRNGVYRRYGYNEPPPRLERKRRRLFQPYYNAPRQRAQQPRRRRWLRKQGRSRR